MMAVRRRRVERRFLPGVAATWPISCRSACGSFIVNGAAPPQDSALVSAMAEAPGRSLSAKFDGEFAAGAQTYAGTGTLRYAW